MNDAIKLTLNESLIAEKVRSEMSRVFVKRLSDSVVTAPLGAILAAWFIYSVAGWTMALVWISILVVIELMILLVGHRFQRCIAQSENGAGWLRAQLALAGLLGLSWSSAVWFVWVEGHMLFYATTICVLVGVSGLCIATMAPQRLATLLFSLGMITPPLLQLTWINSPLELELGVGWVGMFALQAWFSRGLHRDLAQQIDSELRNKSLLQTSAELQTAGELKERENAQLAVELGHMKELVSRDQLTGAYSRRYVFEEMARLTAMRQRQGTQVTAVMFDLDRFKVINDTYGHPTGDRALKEVVRAVSAQLRDGDVLARVGGEEFLVLLPMTDLNSAVQLTERLRHTLSATELSVEAGHSIFLPASFGVCELLPNEGHEDWFKRVDAALYMAKGNGRNTLVAA